MAVTPTFTRHVARDPADHPATLSDPHALGGMFETDHLPMPEHRLWQAVLLLAVGDATGGTTYLKDGDHRDAAAHWLRADNPDFRLVCDLAGLCPERVNAGWLKVRRTRRVVARSPHRKAAP